MSKSQILTPTPLQSFESIFLKREDFNPSGSVKDRAVVVQLAWAKKTGYKKVAASTSGNFGISLGYWAKYFGLKIFVFVSPKTPKLKLQRLKTLPISLKITDYPIKDCFNFCRKNDVLNLRQSLDPRAYLGFSNLGKELAQEIKKKKIGKGSIFFPVSSGTTFLGAMKGLEKAGCFLRPFLVAPASNPYLTSFWDQDYTFQKRKIASALVAKVIPQKEEIRKLVKRYQGSGLVIQNKDIIKWDSYLKKKGVQTSAEGALCFAGVEKAQRQGLINKKDKIICLLTGKRYE
ncbi:MAG: PLP-dependent lyase/thiolase [Candidatus Shapirobacteria bacterium]